MMKQIFSIVFLLISFSITALCGNIVYPWRATTAILKSGESFEVWFNADSGQTIHFIQLNSPYNSVSTSISTVAGNWVYDPMSGNTYTHKITVNVPAGIPADRYDLVLNTSTGTVTSYGGVKIVKKYKDEYYLVHMSDGHLFQGGHDSDVLLKRKSAMIDIANIIISLQKIRIHSLKVVPQLPTLQHRQENTLNLICLKSTISTVLSQHLRALPHHRMYSSVELRILHRPG